MSPDDIDRAALAIFDALAKRGVDLDENSDFEVILDTLISKLDIFVTKDRNYN